MSSPNETTVTFAKHPVGKEGGRLGRVELARGQRKHRFVYAFPSVENRPSNAVCRKMGFTFQKQVDFEHPPGNFMQCNDWRLDLFAGVSDADTTWNSK